MRQPVLCRFLGVHNRDLEVGAGVFHCPNCERTAYCTTWNVQSWFHVFFLPMMPLNDHVSYRRCEDCRRSFHAGTRFPYFPAGGALRGDLRAELRSGGSIEGVQRLLAGLDVDQATVDSVVDELAGATRNTCPRCSQTYLAIIPDCRRCGVPLKTRSTKGTNAASPDPLGDFD